MYFLRRILQQVFLVLMALIAPVHAAQSPVIVQGDIVVGDRSTARSVAVVDVSQLWPEGVIPYTIDASIPASRVAVIQVAIDHWNSIAGVSLMPFTQAQSLSSEVLADSVRFIEGDYCASWVGRRGGQQLLWVAPQCSSGSVMHEIGHLIGLEHEHTRPDRDQYIQIHWDNIRPDKLHNFDAAPAGAQLYGSYDYDSIMHYGTRNFSKNGEPTLSAIGTITSVLGQRVAPSEGDLNSVATLYNSDLSVASRLIADMAGTQLDIYVSNQSQQGAHDVVVSVGSDSGLGAIVVDQKDWQCQRPAKDYLLCSLARLPGSGVQQLSMQLPDSSGEARLNVRLSAKTPDNNLSNNQSRVGFDDNAVESLDFAIPVTGEASYTKREVQQDAVAQAGVRGGAGSGYLLVVVLLLLLKRQARGRIDGVTVLDVERVHGR